MEPQQKTSHWGRDSLKLPSFLAGFPDPPWRHAGARGVPAGGGACLPAAGGGTEPGLGKGGSRAEAGGMAISMENISENMGTSF